MNETRRKVLTIKEAAQLIDGLTECNTRRKRQAL